MAPPRPAGRVDLFQKSLKHTQLVELGFHAAVHELLHQVCGADVLAGLHLGDAAGDLLIGGWTFHPRQAPLLLSSSAAVFFTVSGMATIWRRVTAS